MISKEVFPPRRRGRTQAVSLLLIVQFVVTPLFAVMVTSPFGSAAPVETQDSTTEVITARIDFNGTEGSAYNGTRAGAQGIELGTVLRNFTFGRGYWGAGATLTDLRMAYPGNLSLSPSFSANEVFHARSGAAPRDRDANGTPVWTAGTPLDSYQTLAFDQDGDGWLDDAVVGYTSVNRYYTYNQGGTQIGFRALNPNSMFNDLAAIDSDSNGVLDQLAIAHQGGLVYVERAAATNVWSVNVPGNVPVRFVAGVDLNGDGTLESVLAGADDEFTADDETVYAYNGTGVLKWSYSTGGSSLVNLTAIEATASHALNGALVATNTSLTLLGSAGQVVWNWTSNATVTAAAAADFNDDGIAEGAAYADSAGGITFLDGMGSPFAYSSFLVPPIRSLSAIDLDGDGYLDEVVAANATTVEAVDAQAQRLWNATVGAGFRITMLTHADFDGNGSYSDTIVPTTNTLYVYNRTGGLRWSVTEAPVREFRSVAFLENPSAAAAGSYLSPELDAGTSVGWTNFAAGTAVDSAFENISGWVRFGDGAPGNVSWQPWIGPLVTPTANFTGNSSRFAQVRYDFASTLSPNSANLSFFRLNYTTPADTGYVVTAPFSPAPQASWLEVQAQFNLSGGGVWLNYSADGGANWAPILPGGSIDAANASAPSLRFRIQLDLGTTSPNVASISVRYAQLGLRPIITSPVPSSTITRTFNVTAAASPLIQGVTFAYLPPGNATPVAIGAAAFDGVTSRWWLLWNTTPLEGSGFELRAVGMDARGFRFTSALFPFAIDNTPPAVSVAIPSVNAVLSGVATVEATASSDTVSVSFAYTVGALTTPIGAGVEISPGIWYTTWDTLTAPFSEADNVGISATATDGVGLQSTDPVFPVVVDNQDPWVVIDAPLPSTEVTGVWRVNLTAARDVVAIDLFQNGSEGAATLAGNNTTATFWFFDWSTLPDFYNDTANLTAIARDRADHTAAATVLNLTINNTSPRPTLIAPAIRGLYTGPIYVAASAPLTAVRMEFFYRDGAGAPVLFHSMVEAEKNATSGLWEFIWDSQADAANFNGTIIAVGWPASGAPASDSTDDWILVDNKAPQVGLLAPVISTERMSGDFEVVAFASSDVVSMSLSYRNTATNTTVPVANMVRDASDATLWRFLWSINGTVFVPTATVTATAVDHVGLVGSDTSRTLVLGLRAGDNLPQILGAPPGISLEEDFGSHMINLTNVIFDEDLANTTVYLDNVDPMLVTVRNNGSRGSDGALFLFSVQDAFGEQLDMTLRVVDASGQTATKGIPLHIVPRNDPPSWVDPHDVVYVQAGTPYTMDFSFYVHDVEFARNSTESPLNITTEDPAHISENGSWPLALTFDYPASMAGSTVFVNLSLSDTKVGQDPVYPPVLAPLKIIITNDAVPVLLSPIPAIDLLEDSPRFNIFDLHTYFNDSDEEPLFYYSGLEQGFTVLIEAGVVSISALPKDWYGNTSLFFGANDAQGAFVEARVDLRVAPVNDVPVWDFTLGLTFDQFSVHFGQKFYFDLSPYVRDVDSPRDSLLVFTSQPNNTYSYASTLNGSEAEVAGAGLILVFDYDASYDGKTEGVTIFITDGDGTSIPKTIHVAISDNYPPAVRKTLPREIVMYEGETKSPALMLGEYFQDQDGLLYYSRGTTNVDVQIDNATGALSLESLGEWNGTEVLILRAIDDRDAFLDSTIIITVLPVDDPPRIQPIRDITIDAGALGRILIWQYVTDIDSPASALTVSVSTSYPNAFVAYQDGVITFVYPRAINETYTPPAFDNLRVCVSDGEKSRCATVAIRIVHTLPTPFNWLQFFIFVITAGAGAIVVARHFVEFKVKRAPTVEDIFLVYEDGILIKHISKNVRKYADEDVVTSMLSAIQSFAADSFEDKSHWELREVQFQGRNILIEKAKKFQIFLIFDGDSNEDLKKAVREAAAQIQAKYRKHLKDWDGDPSHFDGVRAIFAPLLSIESAFVPDDVTADELVKAPLVPGAVYVSEADGFGPLLKAYLKDLEGLAVVRLRPATEEGLKLEPLKAKEVETIEVAAPKGIPGEEDDGRTGLDVAVDALKDALSESKVAVRGRAPLVLFEGFEFIVDRYGFVFSKKFADQLKKLASAEGFYLFIAVDATKLSPQQLEGIERGAVVFRGA